MIRTKYYDTTLEIQEFINGSVILNIIFILSYYGFRMFIIDYLLAFLVLLPMLKAWQKRRKI